MSASCGGASSMKKDRKATMPNSSSTMPLITSNGRLCSGSRSDFISEPDITERFCQRFSTSVEHEYSEFIEPAGPGMMLLLEDRDVRLSVGGDPGAEHAGGVER